MTALIYENAYYKSDNSFHQRESLIEALTSREINYFVIQNQKQYYELKSKPDFCIYLDKDISMAKLIEQDGIKVFNNASSIALSDSKIFSYIKAKKSVAQPKSIFSPFRYQYSPLDSDFYTFIENEIQYPLVFKADKSSLGKDVFLVNNAEQLLELDKVYFDKRYILQKFEKKSIGQSIRAIVIGYKVVCFLKYTNNADFRSNKELGGICEKIYPNSVFSETAEKLAKEFDLIYCGIDFFNLKEPKLIEINSNAYFSGALKTYNLNLSEIIIDNILSAL